MKYVVKFLTVAEIDVESELNAAIVQAQSAFDSFRESCLPSENHGVLLYRATPDDLIRDLVENQVHVTPKPADGTF
jgi:hypothetical protein